MADEKSLLQEDPDPIKLVPQDQRDVWTKDPHRWRCDHGDGRGRCTSRETTALWSAEMRAVEHFCAKHLPLLATE